MKPLEEYAHMVLFSFFSFYNLKFGFFFES